MNNFEIGSLLRPYLKKEVFDHDSKVESATTNLQIANVDSICFYHVTDIPGALEIFLERQSKSLCQNLILSRDVEIDGVNIWVVDYSDFLCAQELISNIIYPNKNRMKISGITGTNGKTTVSFLAMQMATLLGFPAISIGTIGIRSTQEILENDILSTTPSYLEFRKIIHKYQDTYQHIFIEVSSHALSQKRLYNIKLDACAWTSFSQDHLDYHKDYEDYFCAKLKILENSRDGVLIVPSSEIELIKRLNCKNVQLDIIDLIDYQELGVGFKASYNKANLAVAKRIVEKVTNRDVFEGLLRELSLPSGRFESIAFNENIVIIDFAHTPDALINICRTIKKDFKGHKLKVVFGCGGDRDKTKRPLMGKAVSEFADSIIITSDNPRSEDPDDIIDDIVSGVETFFDREKNRASAIKLALTNLSDRTVILIAGKGHEEYQEVKGQKNYFSDKEEVIKVLKEFKNV